MQLMHEHNEKSKKTSIAQRVRQLLRENPDGMTLRQIMATNPGVYRIGHLENQLKSMPDAYIDRWVETRKTNVFAAVWAVVVPPENCPRPKIISVDTRKRKKK